MLRNFKLENVPQHFDFFLWEKTTTINKQLFILKAVVKSVFSPCIIITSGVLNVRNVEKKAESRSCSTNACSFEIA